MDENDQAGNGAMSESITGGPCSPWIKKLQSIKKKVTYNVLSNGLPFVEELGGSFGHFAALALLARWVTSCALLQLALCLCVRLHKAKLGMRTQQNLPERSISI